jgi:small-conductance mechanosensitive channel
LIQELRDSGATREEIREAVMQFLEEQGIEIQTPQIGNSNP